MKKYIFGLLVFLPVLGHALSYDSGSYGSSTSDSLNISTLTVTGTATISSAAITSLNFSGGSINGIKTDNSTTTYTSTNIFLGSTTIMGTIINTAPQPGAVGETVSSTTAGAFANFATTGQYGDLAQITLTPGDWLIQCNVEALANGATVTTMRAGISSTSGNSATGLVDGDNFVFGVAPTSTNSNSMVIPSWQRRITSTTIYYLKYQASYSVATPTAAGKLFAQRIR